MEDEPTEPVVQFPGVEQGHLVTIPPEIFSQNPIKKQRLAPLFVVIAILVFVLVSMSGFLIYRKAYDVSKQPSSNLLITPAPYVTIQLRNENVGIGEREIAYFQNGQIWLVSTDLERKMKYDLAGVADSITNFTFSPDGQQL